MQNEATKDGLRGNRDAQVSRFDFAGANIKIACFRDSADVLSLKSEWLSLETRAQNGFDYFQSFDWCFNWINNFDKQPDDQASQSARIYAIWRDDALVMILPMMRTAGLLGYSVLETLSEPLGQYSGVIVDKGRVPRELARRVWSEIKSTSKEDAIVFANLPEGTFLSDMIGKDGTTDRAEAKSSILDCSELDAWDDLFQTWSKNRRKGHNRMTRKLSEAGKVSFECYGHGEDGFKAHVAEALKMKRIWLIETGRMSQMLFRDETEAFLRDLGTHLEGAEDGQGPVVFALCVDDKPIAYEIGMVRGDHYYSYLGAIDMKWTAYSPGAIQIEHAQRWAIENGIVHFDFLSDPSDYKKYWVNKLVDVKTRYIPLTITGTIYCDIWRTRLRPTLRNMYHQASPELRRNINRLFPEKNKRAS